MPDVITARAARIRPVRRFPASSGDGGQGRKNAPAASQARFPGFPVIPCRRPGKRPRKISARGPLKNLGIRYDVLPAERWPRPCGRTLLFQRRAIFRFCL